MLCSRRRGVCAMFVVHKSLACPLKFATACSCLNDIPTFSDLSLVIKRLWKHSMMLDWKQKYRKQCGYLWTFVWRDPEHRLQMKCYFSSVLLYIKPCNQCQGIPVSITESKKQLQLHISVNCQVLKTLYEMAFPEGPKVLMVGGFCLLQSSSLQPRGLLRYVRAMHTHLNYGAVRLYAIRASAMLDKLCTAESLRCYEVCVRNPWCHLWFLRRWRDDERLVIAAD